MQPREFLALADQLQAFQTIMSGALAKEAQDAKQALAKLKDANDLLGLEALMKDREAIFEEAKRKVQLQLDELKAELTAKEKSLTEKEEDLKKKETLMLTLEDSSRVAIKKAEEVSHALDMKIKDTDKKIAAGYKKLAEDRASIDDQLADIARREADIANKLAVIKSLG